MKQDIPGHCKDKFFECPSGFDKTERKELLQKIVDGQASNSEETYFYETLDNCSLCVCKDLCSQHLEIKSILKAKLFYKPIPNGLIEEIKERISGSI